MKVRVGLVSNSSSCSFSIPLNKMTGEQLELLCNHSEEAKRIGLECWECEWDIIVRDRKLTASTIIDSFDLLGFCNLIGIHEEDIEIEYNGN